MKLFSIISTAFLVTAVAAIPSINEAENRDVHQGMKREAEDNRNYICPTDESNRCCDICILQSQTGWNIPTCCTNCGCTKNF
ncbi:hypothetical protein ASPFODRAFT_41699 [Aspergillus luchuensis CBS 106.47]|uniref:Uncharacterized protein n=1 Tax=Aspergillus luchuensis (strain CBS 106.47) TaxID=1137211 RepID=A0A1M3TWV9_ASPLC|nr:hypothetical protein ASPFODRAFT_41699 [Aspergillus luchuensis CBS 106.47]